MQMIGVGSGCVELGPALGFSLFLARFGPRINASESGYVRLRLQHPAVVLARLLIFRPIENAITEPTVTVSYWMLVIVCHVKAYIRSL